MATNPILPQDPSYCLTLSSFLKNKNLKLMHNKLNGCGKFNLKIIILVICAQGYKTIQLQQRNTNKLSPNGMPVTLYQNKEQKATNTGK